jgi:hypothetical protein
MNIMTDHRYQMIGCISNNDFAAANDRMVTFFTGRAREVRFRNKERSIKFSSRVSTEVEGNDY